jgi:predicted nucleotide-binding protein (sugar kinase/HSP70/actin superfamily)
MMPDTLSTLPAVPTYDEIEAEVQAFEAAERRRLGLDEEKVEHWIDRNPQSFTRAERDRTTILAGGLTVAHDQLVSAALAGLGYRIRPLDVPDAEALRFGKEFGNRAQCNPTYFTVGNLVKHLVHLRDRERMPVDEIIRSHVFLTAGACGPCRFGTYFTEYRKALRDAGFDGFRVLLFQQQGGLRQATGEELGLELSTTFFITLLKALLTGDAINLIGYRIRPYEIEPGSTDRALEECKRILEDAFRRRRSILRALWTCRGVLGRVNVNRLQPKPKVAIIGEFWAMTTEGEGNYRLQRFLESEGAEVDIQPVTAWLLYTVWENVWDTKRRMTLREDDEGKYGLKGTNPRRTLVLLKVADVVLRGAFAVFTKTLGLGGYHLSDMDEIATISHQYYDNHLRGGEGHMEVGKLIQHVEQKKSHMVISVKPFGCMPSSGVSDGVQSLVTAKHPESIFCAIETTGDSAVNAQSRILMDLFKARQRASREYQDLLDASGLSQDEAERRAARRGFARALFYPTHILAGTAANTLMDLQPRLKKRLTPRVAAPSAPAAAPRTGPMSPPRVGFKSGWIALVPVSAAATAELPPSGGSPIVSAR